MKQSNKEFFKRLIILALPVIAQRLLTSMVNTIDTMMIGGIGETAISAVAIVNKVFFVYQLINFGLNDGVGIYISQYAGAGDKEKTTDLFNLGLRLSTIVGLIATALLILFLVYLWKVKMYWQWPRNTYRLLCLLCFPLHGQIRSVHPAEFYLCQSFHSIQVLFPA